MNQKRTSVDEEKFLSSYDITAFERPSVAADVAVFSMFEEETDNHRKDSEARIHLLLIKRGEHPYMNGWALPGGFLRPDETIEACAVREVREETNLSLSTLIPIGIFSEPDRDPRGRILSAAFVSIINENAAVTGGTDAIGAAWFALDYQCADDRLRICLTGGGEQLTAELARVKSSFGCTAFEEISNDGLAFDHAKIIATALMTLRERLEEGNVAFAFLPERFTLSALQKVYEMIGGETLLTANFRRKTAHLVRETEEFTEGAGHRPARLFVRNTEKETSWKK